MDCENCDCVKNTISQITQLSFLSVGRNRNTTQFDSQEGRNCESCENYYIEVFFAIFATFAICEIVVFAISQITQFDFEGGIAISQITQSDFEHILQPCNKFLSLQR